MRACDEFENLRPVCNFNMLYTCKIIIQHRLLQKTANAIEANINGTQGIKLKNTYAYAV